MTEPQAKNIEKNELVRPAYESEKSLLTVVGTLGNVSTTTELTIAPDPSDLPPASEKPEQLLTVEGHVANFLLFGTPVPAGVNKQAVRNVLRKFIGSDEVVSSEAITKRFTQLHRFLAAPKKETPPTATRSLSTTALAIGSSRTRSSRPLGAYRFPGAKCIGLDPELFFPGPGNQAPEARAACSVCIARVPCLEAALEDGTLAGIMGGTSERERRRIRKARKERAAEAKPEAIASAQQEESEPVTNSLGEASNL